MGTPRHGPWLKWLAGGVVAGMALLGVLAYAMTTTDSRPFCSTCHIMEEAAVTQKKGTHARLACNECHAPHNLLVKLPFKAQEGLRDFWGNITGKDVPHPVSLHTRDVVNANCKALPRPDQRQRGQYGRQTLLCGLSPQRGPHAHAAHQHKDGSL